MTESSICRFKTIYVFSSIDFDKNKEYLKTAVELGITLTAQKINMVYKGGSLGLKDIIAVSVNIRDSRVIGVMLNALSENRYITGMTIGNELQVLSIYERMGYINHNTDTYIVLSIGLKILKDVFNITSQVQLKIHKKPLGLLNVNSFYDGLLSFLNHAVEQGFMIQANQYILVSTSIDDQLID